MTIITYLPVTILLEYYFFQEYFIKRRMITLLIIKILKREIYHSRKSKSLYN